MLCISYRRDRAAGPFFFFIITCFFFLCAILAITLVFVSRFVFIRMVGRGKEMDEKWCGETYIFPKMGEGRSIMQDGCRVAWRREKERISNFLFYFLFFSWNNRSLLPLSQHISSFFLFIHRSGFFQYSFPPPTFCFFSLFSFDSSFCCGSTTCCFSQSPPLLIT